MPPSTRMPSGAIFDVKPVDETGLVDVEKISAVRPTVNLSHLRPKKTVQLAASRAKAHSSHSLPSLSDPSPIQKSAAPKTPAPEEILPPVIELPSKQNIKQQFDELMSYDLDLGIELARVGTPHEIKPVARCPRAQVARSVPAPVAETSVPEYAPLAYEIHRSAQVASREHREIEIAAVEISVPAVPAEPELSAPVLELAPEAANTVKDFYAAAVPVQLIARKPVRSARKVKRLWRFRPPKKFIIGSLVALGLLAALSALGFHLKRRVVEQSTAAVTSLQTAQTDLKALDFKNASEDFFAAYTDFSKAGNGLNVLGAGITSIIADLPGAGSLKSAQNLLQVGQLLSAAGTAMTSALDGVSKTGAISNPMDGQLPLGSIVSALKKALIASQQEVAQASTLMADVDGSIIPADKQASFDDFKSKFPEMEAAVNMSVDYAKFFENLINTQGYKRYLVMFQNGSELRPTGGFPGTYGVVSFKDGKLDSIFVDDVYNLDGQLKDHIIPPLQMQHITPTWGMRDANWYVDFPTSAKNIETFYKKEADQSVDGVIVINPEMIQKILAIVGPIEMPQYHLTLTADNVLTTIQDQVEYGPNRTQPKQIVKDFAPLFLQKIYAAGSDKWLAIFNTLILSMNEKNVLMNFNDLSLESFVTDKGFGGQVQKAAGQDYLMATVTNIKGSKTDAVTDTSFDLQTSFNQDAAVHTLTITRQHNGGGAQYGFYNKQNPAYIRVLVPEGAELVSISGNDRPNFQPLLNYAKDPSFVHDDQLTKFETSGITDTATGVTTYREAGKGEFGFWLITDPGKSKTVTLTYRVPNALKDKAYELYVQKQPALKVKNFSFDLTPPSGLTPDASAPVLNQTDSRYVYSTSLENDLPVKVTFK